MIFKTYNIQAVSVFRDYIEDSNVPCGDCNKCCTNLAPNLTPEEFESGKYIYTLTTSPLNNLPVISVPRDENGCIYLKNNKCSIYDNRPKACRQFSCIDGHYPPFKDFVLEKFGIDITNRIST